jgi:hypothetical protein
MALSIFALVSAKQITPALYILSIYYNTNNKVDKTFLRLLFIILRCIIKVHTKSIKCSAFAYGVGIQKEFSFVQSEMTRVTNPRGYCLGFLSLKL